MSVLKNSPAWRAVNGLVYPSLLPGWRTQGFTPGQDRQDTYADAHRGVPAAGRMQQAAPLAL